MLKFTGFGVIENIADFSTILKGILRLSVCVVRLLGSFKRAAKGRGEWFNGGKLGVGEHPDIEERPRECEEELNVELEVDEGVQDVDEESRKLLEVFDLVGLKQDVSEELLCWEASNGLSKLSRSLKLLPFAPFPITVVLGILEFVILNESRSSRRFARWLSAIFLFKLKSEYNEPLVIGKLCVGVWDLGPLPLLTPLSLTLRKEFLERTLL